MDYGERASVLECSSPLELWHEADIAKERENGFVTHARMGEGRTPGGTHFPKI
jgi:hypothetical protein